MTHDSKTIAVVRAETAWILSWRALAYRVAWRYVTRYGARVSDIDDFAMIALAMIHKNKERIDNGPTRWRERRAWQCANKAVLRHLQHHYGWARPGRPNKKPSIAHMIANGSTLRLPLEGDEGEE